MHRIWRTLTTKWLLAVSYWLTFGDPSPLRLGNSNKFDCSRLNRGVGFNKVSALRIYISRLADSSEIKEFREISDFSIIPLNSLTSLNSLYCVSKPTLRLSGVQQRSHTEGAKGDNWKWELARIFSISHFGAFMPRLILPRRSGEGLPKASQ
jgi:hypothetical protein